MKQYKKQLLIDFVENLCENCKKYFEDKELEIHRIKRGCQGGTYDLRNVNVLCHKCHKLIHFKEFK